MSDEGYELEYAHDVFQKDTITPRGSDCYSKSATPSACGALSFNGNRSIATSVGGLLLCRGQIEMLHLCVRQKRYMYLHELRA
jgi:hypothetical protein